MLMLLVNVINRKMKIKLNYTLLVVILVGQFGCEGKKKVAEGNAFNDPILYCKTVKELNNVVKENNFPPIIASRNYAYASIAAYEVVALNDKRFRSLAGQIKHLSPLPQLSTRDVNFEYASMLAFIKVGEAVTFPAGSLKNYTAMLDTVAHENGITEASKKATLTLANAVADHIIAWSKKDNYAETRTAEKYTVRNEEGRWVPTPPAYSQALEPHWNEIRPMAMTSANEFIPPPPPPYNVKDTNSKFYQEMIALKRAGDSLTDEQKHIAIFWDDLGSKVIVEGHLMFTAKKFSPTGHWMNIVGIAAEKSKADFGTTVYAYAKTAIAMFDAFIQCWDEKFRSNYLRPETAINKNVDAEWRPYLQTPPFPEYTCGHSTVSASAAETLTDVFGDNFAYTDTSELEFGIRSRSFPSFRAAAIENNWARFYGGIHYHNSCIVSTAHGIKVGEAVNQRLRMKK
jgi:hypothetical protein